MRTLVARKMAKQKTFYEMKVQEQNPITLSPVNRMMQLNNQSLGIGVSNMLIKNQRVTMQSPPNVRKIS